MNNSSRSIAMNENFKDKCNNHNRELNSIHHQKQTQLIQTTGCLDETGYLLPNGKLWKFTVFNDNNNSCHSQEF